MLDPYKSSSGIDKISGGTTIINQKFLISRYRLVSGIPAVWAEVTIYRSELDPWVV
jgi:hypothetical protein